jgi:hypothetical protein
MTHGSKGLAWSLQENSYKSSLTKTASARQFQKNYASKLALAMH